MADHKGYTPKTIAADVFFEIVTAANRHPGDLRATINRIYPDMPPGKAEKVEAQIVKWAARCMRPVKKYLSDHDFDWGIVWHDE